MIVIDDLERFIDYAPIGPRFSNVALQALIILLKTPPPKGKKLFVIGTTSQADILDRLGLLSSVDSTLEVPSVSTGLMACNVWRNFLPSPCLRSPGNKKSANTVHQRRFQPHQQQLARRDGGQEINHLGRDGGPSS